MKASQCSFEKMMVTAAGNSMLAEATSFIQVEFGLNELKASWQGFVDTSNHFNISFKSRKHICGEFALALADYIGFLEEPSPLQMGH